MIENLYEIRFSALHEEEKRLALFRAANAEDAKSKAKETYPEFQIFGVRLVTDEP